MSQVVSKIAFLLSVFFPMAAFAEGDAAQSPYGSLVMLAGFFAIFYFMLWRPQSKRMKEQRQLMSSLSKGDEVVTTGGILGKITKVTDTFVTLALTEGVEVLVQKQAIAAAVPKGTMKAT